MSNTGRATNPAWYTSPLELGTQFHIRVDGERIDTWIHDRTSNRWQAGPLLSADILTESTQSEGFASNFLQSLPAANHGLGVILHMADEFATAELSPETASSHSLLELHSALQEQPSAILDDKSFTPQDHGCGVFPYGIQTGKSPATAVIHSRKFEPILTAFRHAGEARKLPVQTAALSSPLLTIQSLPFLVTANLACAFVGVFHYPKFTTLAFFNKQGNLLLLRSLPHRTQRRPHHLYFAINTTATSLEFVEPQIVYLSYLGAPDLPLLEELTRSFGPHRVSVVDWQQTQFHASSTTPEFAEPQFAVTSLSSATTPLAKSETFSALKKDQWALQDFIPAPREETELYPTQQEVQLLKTTRIARWGIFGTIGAVAAWSAVAIIGALRDPAWEATETTANAAKQKLAPLTVEQARITHWDNLLEDRSRSWSAMELISQMFPENSGIQIQSIGYTLKATTATSSASRPTKAPLGQSAPPPPLTKSGFSRGWKISGTANNQAVREILPALADREALSRIFQQTAEITQDSSFASAPTTRIISSQISTNEAAGKNGGSYNFTLDIEQTFSPNDPLAPIISAAP